MMCTFVRVLTCSALCRRCALRRPDEDQRKMDRKEAVSAGKGECKHGLLLYTQRGIMGDCCMDLVVWCSLCFPCCFQNECVFLRTRVVCFVWWVKVLTMNTDKERLCKWNMLIVAHNLFMSLFAPVPINIIHMSCFNCDCACDRIYGRLHSFM